MLKILTHKRNLIKTLSQLTFLLLFVYNCIKETKEETRNDESNLNNNTSTFIYNMIPKNSNASISTEYSEAINTFSVNLLNEVYKDEMHSDKNLVLSPFSVSRNLAVLTEGTTGESKQELLDALLEVKSLWMMQRMP